MEKLVWFFEFPWFIFYTSIVVGIYNANFGYMGIVEIPVLKNMSVRYELTQDQAYYTSICLVRDLR